jgi:hypothetical protein
VKTEIAKIPRFAEESVRDGLADPLSVKHEYVHRAKIVTAYVLWHHDVEPYQLADLMSNNNRADLGRPEAWVELVKYCYVVFLRGFFEKLRAVVM